MGKGEYRVERQFKAKHRFQVESVEAVKADLLSVYGTTDPVSVLDAQDWEELNTIGDRDLSPYQPTSQDLD